MKIKPIYLIICLVAIVGLIWFFTKGNLRQGPIYLMILICPIMHLFMMKGMHGKHKSDTDKNIKDGDSKTKSCH